MQSYFEEELGKLKKKILKMFALVDNQLDKSMQSVFNPEFDPDDSATKNENRIDKLDVKIDKLCQRIFALAQPVATDLRFIMSSLRIGNEIERIGDIFLEILERSETIRSYQETIAPFGIAELFRNISTHMSRLSEAYTNNNSDLAREVLDSCRKTRETCKSIFQEIIAGMTAKSEIIIIATDLILVVRDIERISSHAENVAESIIFIAEGKRLK
jgi:phosphate transport system protein